MQSQPYERAAGVGSEYPAVDVDAVLAAEREEVRAAACAAAAPAPPAPRPPPSAVSTVSARELHAQRRMNVPPRWAPAERFDEPQTAAQECGWKVAAAAAAAAAAAHAAAARGAAPGGGKQ